MGKGVESVKCREGVVQDYYTEVGSCDGGLVAKRGLLKLLTDVNHALREVKSGALSGATEQSPLLQIQTSHGGSRH